MLSPSGEELKKKITNKTAKVSVIGLGYVGLPLAIEIGKSGFSVLGIDVNKEMKVILDTDILSMFVKIDELKLLGQLFGRGNLAITPKIMKEKQNSFRNPANLCY